MSNTSVLFDTGDPALVDRRRLRALVGAAAAWTPADIPDLVAWYAAHQLSGLADGAAVTTAPDESGNGHTLNEDVGNGAASPTFRTNVLNGQPCIRFVSAPRSYRLATPSADFEGAAFTWIAVARFRVAADLHAVVSRTTADGGGWNLVMSAEAEEDISSYGPDALYRDFRNPRSTTPLVATMRRGLPAANTFRLWDGTALFTNTTSGAPSTNTTNLVFGRFYDGSPATGSCDVDLFEFAYWSRALTDVEVAAAQAELLSRYGL